MCSGWSVISRQVHFTEFSKKCRRCQSPVCARGRLETETHVKVKQQRCVLLAGMRCLVLLFCHQLFFNKNAAIAPSNPLVTARNLKKQRSSG